MTPLVTIGVPTYRRPEGLRRVLGEIRAQTHTNLEILVSDNASPEPDTRRVVEEAAASDSRIVYRRQERNLGAGGNFTYLARHATGKYFGWFADDDLSAPTFVQRLVETLESTPDAVLAMTDVIQVDEGIADSRKIIELSTIRADADWATTRELFFRYPTSNVFFSIYGIFRTEALQRCRLSFDSRVSKHNFGAEVPFLADVATKGRIVSVPEPLKTYVRHPASVHNQEMANLRRFGSLMRGLELRSLVSLAATNADVPVSERLRLSVLPWRPLVDKMARRARGLVSRVSPRAPR